MKTAHFALALCCAGVTGCDDSPFPEDIRACIQKHVQATHPACKGSNTACEVAELEIRHLHHTGAGWQARVSAPVLGNSPSEGLSDTHESFRVELRRTGSDPWQCTEVVAE